MQVDRESLEKLWAKFNTELHEIAIQNILLSFYFITADRPKLTTSLIYLSLKFQTFISEKHKYILLKRREKLLSFARFLHKNISEFGYKGVKHFKSWPINDALNNWVQVKNSGTKRRETLVLVEAVCYAALKPILYPLRGNVLSNLGSNLSKINKWIHKHINKTQEKAMIFSGNNPDKDLTAIKYS